MRLKKVTSLVCLSLALIACAHRCQAQNAESLRNRPELSLPLVEGKPVVAHFMTDLIFQRGVGQGDIMSPSMYGREGPSKEIGGMIQHYPMVARLKPDLSLEDAVAFEMRAAQRLGVDGFQFYYPLSENEAYTNRCVDIIKAFFQVAERAYPDFKLTLCLCNPHGEGTEAEKIARWSESIGRIVAATRVSRNWLRTPDGRVIFFQWIVRKLWGRAIELDAPMVNLVTWNDYPEGHHLAPEINHNFGFSLLLRHYKAQWKGMADDIPEAAIVFFKKYRHDVEPDPFAIPIHIKAAVGEEAGEDVIDILTLLKQPGELLVDGTRCSDVEQGLQVSQVPSRPGRVHITVRRHGQDIIDFTTPEAITGAPYRTDRMTYTYSSEFGRIFRQLFGDVEPFTSCEYGEAP